MAGKFLSFICERDISETILREGFEERYISDEIPWLSSSGAFRIPSV